jgi:hypothetical protein
MSPDKSGFHGESHHDASGVPDSAPSYQTWMTDELIADTRRVWSTVYRRPLSEDEAKEILRNVRRLAELLTSM